MWFKNLYFFKLDEKIEASAEKLHDMMTAKVFSPCSPTQKESFGWIEPLGEKSSSLTHAVSQYTLITLARQERILPATVVRETLDERVSEIEVAEDRKVSNKEKKELKEAIEFELLPRAFTRTQKVDAWLDSKGGWLVVNTSSAKRAEDVSGLLRKCLGSFAVSLPSTETPVSDTMTRWLSTTELPEPFDFGQECELVSSQDDKSKVIVRNHSLLDDTVQNHLSAGKQVSKLSLEWSEKLRFTLTEDLQIKKLQFLDVMDEAFEETDPQSHEERVDIEFALMTGEVSDCWQQLLKVLSE